jgi:hypothetical protein
VTSRYPRFHSLEKHCFWDYREFCCFDHTAGGAIGRLVPQAAGSDMKRDQCQSHRCLRISPRRIPASPFASGHNSVAFGRHAEAGSATSRFVEDIAKTRPLKLANFAVRVARNRVGANSRTERKSPPCYRKEDEMAVVSDIACKGAMNARMIRSIILLISLTVFPSLK